MEEMDDGSKTQNEIFNHLLKSLQNEQNPSILDRKQWDPASMLSNLSVLEEKIHQLRELVSVIVKSSSWLDRQSTDQLMIQKQHLVTADLAAIIIQLVSTAASLLPSVTSNPVNVCDNGCDGNVGNVMISKVEDQSNDNEHMDVHEEHDDDVDEGENLCPGSYEILQLEKEEILAPHTHFCVICGKGFKRDANLRMHMRGHGDEYKTPAALAKPHKDAVAGGSEQKLIKRYSCPYLGCKRNKDHSKFQPLKTILCVKNHYKRTHCDKSYTCSRCNTKKFSVIADLKTHEKHCGRERWLCSCGTTFSRKDKLFGHISLFQGHTPAIPVDEPKPGSVSLPDPDRVTANNPQELGFFDFNFNSNGSSESGVQIAGEPGTCFSPMNGFQEFSSTMFEESDSLSFFLSGSGNYPWKNTAAGESSSKDLL